MSITKQALRLFVAVPIAALLASCSAGSPGPVGSEPAGEPQRGGAVTVLGQQGWPTGLDPATRTSGDQQLMSAIYGGLFKLAENKDKPSGAEVVPDLAESYEITEEGKTLTIKLRPGVQFQDGTPLNADAVIFNFTRAISSPCSCAPKWPLQTEGGMTAPDESTVVLRFTRPPSAIIHSFLGSNANWMASPTAVKAMGDQFKVSPVGAGPFKVATNELSSQLVLEANKNYWQKDLPYLDTLTFKVIEEAQVGYQAMVAGQAQAYIGMDSVSLADVIRKGQQFTVTDNPATSPMAIQLNTKKGPFADKRAREAIYYATDAEAINKGLFGGAYSTSQMFTAPGGLFHHSEVPGYRTFDVEKARALVKELGGLEVTLGTIASPVAEDVITVLQTQWEAAGIKTTIKTYGVPALLKEYEAGEWDAMQRVVGGWDPTAGIGVSGYFASNGRYSGVTDPKLDELLETAGTSLDPATRDKQYLEAGKYISDQAYAPFILAYAPVTVTDGVHGPGLTTKIPPFANNSPVIWDQVWTEKSAK